jgi:uncharacterized membrane protein (UPF0127 family)
MKHITVRQALQQVADYPVPLTDEVILMPTHEMICRTLFDIANTPDAKIRGSMGRANKARGMIMNRLVGRRRAGSHPATRVTVDIDFVDLTGGELDGE